MDFNRLSHLFNPPQPKAPESQSVPRVSTEFAMNHNPFMISVNPDKHPGKDDYGVNRPLKKAAFLGYWNDQPLYGGNRLFILY